MDPDRKVETVQLCAAAFQYPPLSTSYIVVVLTNRKGEGLPTLRDIIVAIVGKLS